MNNKKSWLIGGAIILLILVAGIYYNTQRSKQLRTLPNIIFILTDDMDTTLLPYMQYTNKLIGEQGATFTNYFVTSTACCPSRATTIRGQYPHNTGILENSPGFEEFYRLGHDDDTLAVWMKQAGYKNSFMGKYLNLYPAGVKRSYISPGWSDWHVFLYNITPDFYFGYTMNENGKLVKYYQKDYDYSTDVLRDRAIEYIDKYSKRASPFFIFVSTYAPHGPDDPAPRHADLYPDLVYPKGPSYHEEDTSDKPQDIIDLRINGGIFEDEEADDLFRRRVRTMMAVDEMVRDLVKNLEENGQLDNTYIIFTSDNGFHMGEHGLPSGKMLAYEEDIRVPFLMRGPGIAPGTVVTQMTANIDLASTFSELAGAQPAAFVDGRSFAPLLGGQNNATDWRKALLFETGYSADQRPSHVITWRGVRTENFIYVEYESGELEFYDLVNDPYEMDNIASQLDENTLSILHGWLAKLKTCTANECRQLENNIPEGIQYGQ